MYHKVCNKYSNTFHKTHTSSWTLHNVDKRNHHADDHGNDDFFYLFVVVLELSVMNHDYVVPVLAIVA